MKNAGFNDKNCIFVGILPFKIVWNFECFFFIKNVVVKMWASH